MPVQESRTKITKRTLTSVRVRPTREDLRQLAGVPKHAKNVAFQVQVPGGADWSNTILNIGEETELEISWEIEEIEEVQ
jgi:hypothetical protein